MQVNVLYFAILREKLGRSTERRSLDPDATIGDLMDQLVAENPVLNQLRRSVMLMVNQQYVSTDHVLSDGDEVAFIPPVSGGSTVSLFRIQTEPLDAREVEAAVAGSTSGAIVTFTGTVRDNARGQLVSALDYEAYAPAAEKILAQIGDEIHERWNIERVAVIHRVGRLEIGEASVVIAVSSPHRGEAFAACQYVIDRLKAIVPIWKKEWYADGASWIGSEAEYQRQFANTSIVDK